MRTIDVAADVEVTLLRIDPPVDARYLHTTYLLDLVETCGGRVANRPAGIRALHEKLVGAAVPAPVPRDRGHRRPGRRPRPRRPRAAPPSSSRSTGSPGSTSGCFATTTRRASLAESATRGGTRHVIAQAYLADVEHGNKRLFLVDGEVVGAVLRRPSPTDFRIGPPVAHADVDAADLTIVAALGPLLAAHGIALAGLDVIAGRLIEVNVTCPGGMHKTDALLGTDLSGATMRRLLVTAPITERSPRMNTDTVAIVCIALLGILLFLLGANVTRHRAIRGDTGNQMPTDPADRMFIAQRAHGNAAEYVPTLIVLILVCASLSDGWWVQALAVAAVVSRSLHALGHADLEDPGVPRTRP